MEEDGRVNKNHFFKKFKICPKFFCLQFFFHISFFFATFAIVLLFLSGPPSHLHYINKEKSCFNSSCRSLNAFLCLSFPPVQETRAFLYLLKNYPRKLLEEDFYPSYESGGAHGKRFHREWGFVARRWPLFFVPISDPGLSTRARTDPRWGACRTDWTGSSGNSHEKFLEIWRNTRFYKVLKFYIILLNTHSYKE